jgi:hypothetical protein
MEINSKYFYEQLKKMMEQEDEDQSDIDLCKITQTPLREDHVTLECGHKFNYDAIFNEIYQQKCVFQSYTLMSAIQSIEAKFKSKKECLYFIRCPYCRNIQFSLIPSKEGCKSVYGINTNELKNEDVPYLLNIPPNVYIHKKMVYKYHGKQCDADDCQFEQTTHFSKINKYYCICHTHHGIVATKEMEKSEKILQKKAQAEAKLQAKLQAKKEKLEAKIKAKEVAKKTKQEAKMKAKQDAKKSA